MHCDLLQSSTANWGRDNLPIANEKKLQFFENPKPIIIPSIKLTSPWQTQHSLPFLTTVAISQG